MYNNKLVGVLSWGRGNCENFDYGNIYTSVYYHRNWIYYNKIDKQMRLGMSMSNNDNSRIEKIKYINIQILTTVIDLCLSIFYISHYIIEPSK